ncbi:hypothetical protein ACLIBH_05640 [Virgibacillus sp. W0430]|uniref:hypothetical protein n=1 Tax=Virgibacillus sp. W0430 TaxID=3391580 RepID=UPI003F45CB70
MRQDVHNQLQQASQQIKSAQGAVLQAQGSDEGVLNQADEQLQQAEHVLRRIQEDAGWDITKNAQFQQAFEQLHDVRQQVQEAQQNLSDIL